MLDLNGTAIQLFECATKFLRDQILKNGFTHYETFYMNSNINADPSRGALRKDISPKYKKHCVTC